MNYSTLKKTITLSFVSLIVVGMASASALTTKSKEIMMMSDTGATAKLFGGASQYNTWSIGVNIGLTSPSVFTGGINPFNNPQIDFGYGVSVKDQLSHSFGLQLDYHGGTLKGDNKVNVGKDDGPYSYDAISNIPYTNFSTKFNSFSLSGVVNIGSVNFLHRTNSVNFFVTGGAGFDYYKPSPVTAYGVTVPWSTVSELIIPVGAGVKFKLTDQLDLNVGYTENFVDGFNLTGVHSYPNENKYSYGYAGLEYTLGSKSKSSLEWVNPVAIMYDELYDEALRKEVEALKGRVSNVEAAVAALKKDSDGDGVSDQFDKCPNTPAGTVVDGSGCAIVFPAPIDTSLFERKKHEPVIIPYSTAQFDFDSAVLKPGALAILDATAAELKKTPITVIVAGYASSEGTVAHNLHLSKERAESVKKYLVNSGVDGKLLKIKAYGETHPVADNSTEEGRIANRRVEFKK